jgi:hypothetical protein
MSKILWFALSFTLLGCNKNKLYLSENKDFIVFGNNDSLYFAHKQSTKRSIILPSQPVTLTYSSGFDFFDRCFDGKRKLTYEVNVMKKTNGRISLKSKNSCIDSLLNKFKANEFFIMNKDYKWDSIIMEENVNLRLAKKKIIYNAVSEKRSEFGLTLKEEVQLLLGKFKDWETIFLDNLFFFKIYNNGEVILDIKAPLNCNIFLNLCNTYFEDDPFYNRD